MRKQGIDEILRELTTLREQIESLSEEEIAAARQRGGIPDLCNPLPPYARGTEAEGAFRPTSFQTVRSAH
jgi:hypothetical protein